ncbi:MAG: CDP-alcohol phosphatidyltransferase family protein [candidate division WOR-3 bacterium]|nr:MAG: CDP-alcohol phosphatidyltransferase family protein [candidate division WOR-3 bacterium]
MERIKIFLPDILTGINICIGFTCIILVLQVPRVTGTFHHNYIVSAWLVVIAAMIDGFDGALARRLGKTGPFGIEFDSLADLTAFAIAPGTLLYAFFYQGHSVFFVLVPLLYVICSAYRLARFNTSAIQVSQKKLIGLATPVSAVIVVAVVLLVANFYQRGVLQEVSWSTRGVITGVVLIISLLMVSSIEFITFDKYCFGNKKRLILLFFVIIVPLLLLRFKFPAASVLIVGLFYIAECLGRWLLRTRTAHSKNKT